MSFNNRRGGYDRRPDRPDRPDRDRPDRRDRPPRREGGGDWQPRDRAPGGGGGYGGGGYGGRPSGGGGRPYGQRPHADEGAMSLRLDPRRLGHLKQLAGEAGVRPGDLVRQWVEERIDAERGTAPGVATGGLAERVAELVERVAALEIAAGMVTAPPAPDSVPTPKPDEPAAAEPSEASDAPAAEQEPKPPRKRTTAKRASAAPSERVALHDEMIEVLRERGPLTAAELAAAITERGRYAPPRSGKPIDAAMVSQRVSNPTYRSRFVRADGRIGLAEIEGT